MGSLRVGHDWATSLSLSCTGEGNVNPLQYSCLENPRDGGAWWAAVYGVAQSWTRLKRLSSSSSSWDSKLPTASLVRGFPASPGWVSIPNSFVSLFVFYNLSYLLSKRMGCLSGCLVSSASIQKLFCGSCSAFKWSFDEFWGEKWSPHPIPLSFRTVPPRIILVRRERLKWNIFILVLNFYFSIGFNCIYLPLEKASFLLYCICSKNISSISHDCSLYIFYV